jgi:hypothetical protein
VARRRPPLVSQSRLPLANLIDVLVVVLVFLLSRYEVSGDCCLRRSIDRPGAWSVVELVDAPIVAVDASGAITVDGGPAGAAPGRDGPVGRQDELFAVLHGKAALWRELHPGAPLPGLLLDLDRGLPAGAVKSLVLTARDAGYPRTSFAVNDLR